MAELKNIIVSVVFLLFIATAFVSMYSSAVQNNITNGGSGETVPFPLLNQTAAYTARMNNFSATMANATINAADSPTASTGGLGVVTQVGAQALTLSIDSLGMLIGMISATMQTLGFFGLPPFVYAFGILAISVTFIYVLAGVVLKWWI